MRIARHDSISDSNPRVAMLLFFRIAYLSLTPMFNSWQHWTWRTKSAKFHHIILALTVTFALHAISPKNTEHFFYSFGTFSSPGHAKWNFRFYLHMFSTKRKWNVLKMMNSNNKEAVKPIMSIHCVCIYVHFWHWQVFVKSSRTWICVLRLKGGTNQQKVY